MSVTTTPCKLAAMSVTANSKRALKPNPTHSAKHCLLFNRTTVAEEQTLVVWRYFYFAAWWAVTSAYAAGICTISAYGLLSVVIMLRFMLANHNCLHMRTAAQTGLVFRACMPVLGFLPISSTFGDNLHQHLKDHHLHTKAVLDVHDPDSWWSLIPLPLMLLGMMISPSDASALEVLGQYRHGPSLLWPERLFSTAAMWVQYALLSRMGVLLPALIMSHVGCVATFIFFHGLLHRPSFYKFLVDFDPTGRRRIPVVDAIFNILIDPAAWLEIKFHDVHHAHFGIGSGHMHYTSGRATVAEIERAYVAMSDEGLFVDAEGRGVSPLESVGHRLGTYGSHLMRVEK